MNWFKQNSVVDPAMLAEISAQAGEVSSLFSSMKRVKTASSGEKADLHFYVDPFLAEKYHINIHMAQSANEPMDDSRKIVSAESKVSDFLEETVSFPSKRTYEPNYVCSVVFQKPENEVYAVSAYMMETYLGRYAYKANYYFRKGSRGQALRCYNRVLTAIKDLKMDFAEKDLKQSEVPYHLRRALQGESGEVEPNSNKVATFLDPQNVAPKTTVGSENILTIPSHRSIKDDLRLGE